MRFYGRGLRRKTGPSLAVSSLYLEVYNSEEWVGRGPFVAVVPRIPPITSCIPPITSCDECSLKFASQIQRTLGCLGGATKAFPWNFVPGIFLLSKSNPPTIPGQTEVLRIGVDYQSSRLVSRIGSVLPERSYLRYSESPRWVHGNPRSTRRRNPMNFLGSRGFRSLWLQKLYGVLRVGDNAQPPTAQSP